MNGFLLQSTRPIHILGGLLGLALVALFSINSDIKFKMGTMEFPLSTMIADMSAGEREQARMAAPVLAPVAAFGVTAKSPMQDLIGSSMPGLLGGAGAAAGGPMGGGIGGALGELGRSLIGSGYSIQTSLVSGIAGLVLMMLVVILIRRDSRAAFWQVPFSVAFGLGYLLLLNYSISLAVKQAQADMGNSSDPLNRALAPLAGLEQISFEYFPFLLHLALYALLAAAIARLLTMWLAASGRYAFADLPAGTPLNLAAVFQGLREGSPVARVAAVASGTSQYIDRLIDFAAVCPFCGNSKIRHRPPGVCSVCKRNIRGLTESANAELCPDCENRLVKNAQFCHSCGLFLKRGGA